MSCTTTKKNRTLNEISNNIVLYNKLIHITFNEGDDEKTILIIQKAKEKIKDLYIDGNIQTTLSEDKLINNLVRSLANSIIVEDETLSATIENIRTELNNELLELSNQKSNEDEELKTDKSSNIVTEEINSSLGEMGEVITDTYTLPPSPQSSANIETFKDFSNVYFGNVQALSSPFNKWLQIQLFKATVFDIDTGSIVTGDADYDVNATIGALIKKSQDIKDNLTKEELTLFEKLTNGKQLTVEESKEVEQMARVSSKLRDSNSQLTKLFHYIFATDPTTVLSLFGQQIVSIADGKIHLKQRVASRTDAIEDSETVDATTYISDFYQRLIQTTPFDEKEYLNFDGKIMDLGSKLTNLMTLDTDDTLEELSSVMKTVLEDTNKQYPEFDEHRNLLRALYDNIYRYEPNAGHAKKSYREAVEEVYAKNPIGKADMFGSITNNLIKLRTIESSYVQDSTLTTSPSDISARSEAFNQVDKRFKSLKNNNVTSITINSFKESEEDKELNLDNINVENDDHLAAVVAYSIVGGSPTTSQVENVKREILALKRGNNREKITALKDDLSKILKDDGETEGLNPLSTMVLKMLVPQVYSNNTTVKSTFTSIEGTQRSAFYLHNGQNSFMIKLNRIAKKIENREFTVFKDSPLFSIALNGVSVKRNAINFRLKEGLVMGADVKTYSELSLDETLHTNLTTWFRSKYPSNSGRNVTKRISTPYATFADKSMAFNVELDPNVSNEKNAEAFLTNFYEKFAIQFTNQYSKLDLGLTEIFTEIDSNNNLDGVAKMREKFKAIKIVLASHTRASLMEKVRLLNEQDEYVENPIELVDGVHFIENKNGSLGLKDSVEQEIFENTNADGNFKKNIAAIYAKAKKDFIRDLIENSYAKQTKLDGETISLYELTSEGEAYKKRQLDEVKKKNGDKLPEWLRFQEEKRILVEMIEHENSDNPYFTLHETVGEYVEDFVNNYSIIFPHTQGVMMQYKGDNPNSQFTDNVKRNVSLLSNFTPFLSMQQGSQYKIFTSTIDNQGVDVFSILGVKETKDQHDGAGFALPTDLKKAQMSSGGKILGTHSGYENQKPFSEMQNLDNGITNIGKMAVVATSNEMILSSMTNINSIYDIFEDTINDC